MRGLEDEWQGQAEPAALTALQDQVLVVETTQQGHSEFILYHQELMKMSLDMHKSLDSRIARLEAAILWTSEEMTSMLGSRALLGGLQSRFRTCFPEVADPERDEDLITVCDM